MQRTRRAFLDYLKRRPGATLEELANAGGIAPITARSHLAILTAAGLVRSGELRRDGSVVGSQVRGRGRGRPARRYTLTEAADAYFPKHYDRLALSLLAGVSQLEGGEAVEALIEHVAGGMAAAYLPRVEGKPLAERVAAVAEMIEEQGGAADWEPTESGYIVREHNCPYLSVSRCDDHVCEIDRRVVARVAGAPVEVTQRLRDGADSCDFVILAPDAGPARSAAGAPAPLLPGESATGV